MARSPWPQVASRHCTLPLVIQETATRIRPSHTAGCARQTADCTKQLGAPARAAPDRRPGNTSCPKHKHAGRTKRKTRRPRQTQTRRPLQTQTRRSRPTQTRRPHQTLTHRSHPTHRRRPHRTKNRLSTARAPIGTGGYRPTLPTEAGTHLCWPIHWYPLSLVHRTPTITRSRAKRTVLAAS